jgi:hypothetical protein
LKAKERATTSSSAGVARGEIQVRPHLTKKTDRVASRPAPHTPPSVLVNIDSLPPPRVMAATITAPLTAHRRAPSPAPSVIIAPPVPAPADPAAIKTPPLARGDGPMRKKNPAAASSFNAVEADFFEREADLYKGEATETFDDLDGTGAPRRPRTTRKG